MYLKIINFVKISQVKSQVSMFLMDTKHTLFAPDLSHVIVDLLPCQALFFVDFEQIAEEESQLIL